VVNQELEQLDLALPALRATLGPGGRMAVITYHSGEDRIVKHAFRDWSRSCVCPPRQPVCTCRGRSLGRLLTRKPIRPGPAEVRAVLVRRAQGRLGLHLPGDSGIVLVPAPSGSR